MISGQRVKVRTSQYPFQLTKAVCRKRQLQVESRAATLLPARSLVLMRKGDEGWSLVDLRGSALGPWSSGAQVDRTHLSAYLSLSPTAHVNTIVRSLSRAYARNLNGRLLAAV